MTEILRQSTLLFLVKDDKILLALKKRGFGKGKYNGVGGKLEAGESTTEAAIRECQEEIGVTPKLIDNVAILDFIFAEDKSDWNQQVIVYLCSAWEGDPIETDEMKPKWFSLDSIPYDDMWPDDKYWLPQALNNKFVKASFKFDEDESIVDYEMDCQPIKR